MKLVGYARVSTVEQNLDMQIAALKALVALRSSPITGCRGPISSVLAFSRLSSKSSGVTCSSFGDLTDLALPCGPNPTVNGLSRRGCDFRSLTEHRYSILGRTAGVFT